VRVKLASDPQSDNGGYGLALDLVECGRLARPRMDANSVWGPQSCDGGYGLVVSGPQSHDGGYGWLWLGGMWETC
jgi:hypothetical protein